MSPIRVAALCGLFVLVPSLAFAEEMAPVALNSMSQVPANLSSAPVMDQNGKVIGQVDKVQADVDGKPSALSFRAHNGQLVVVSAAAASFDGKVLITSNDQPQIAALSQTRTAFN
jgi:sporulation protein YlmC with PRC-barrel domain